MKQRCNSLSFTLTKCTKVLHKNADQSIFLLLLSNYNNCIEMEKKRVLFISQEITPYLPETKMSRMGRYLPQGIQEKGKEIRTFMPRYGLINERRNQLHEVIRLSGMNLVINDTDHPLIIKVASIQAARMQVYFIDNEDYFHRKHILTDDAGTFFADNDERAMFFAKGVIETVKKLRWSPDLVHCQGMITGLVPLFLKKEYHDDPLFENTKVVYSVGNDEFGGELDKNLMKKLEMEGFKSDDVKTVETPTFENYSKLAIDYSDAVIEGAEDINENVKDYIESTKKPFLSYVDEEGYIGEYNNFYDQIL